MINYTPQPETIPACSSTLTHLPSPHRYRIGPVALLGLSGYRHLVRRRGMLLIVVLVAGFLAPCHQPIAEIGRSAPLLCFITANP